MSFDEKNFYATGYKGVIDGLFEAAGQAGDSGKHPTPIREMYARKEFAFNVAEDFRLGIREVVAKHFAPMYKNQGVFGPYGEIIKISRYDMRHLNGTNLYTLGYISQRAFVKPGLAGDFVMLLKDSEGSLFWIFIRRGKNPGKGKIAFPGGFQDIKGYMMETGAQTAIREAGEEAMVKISPSPSDSKEFDDPNVMSLRVTVEINGVNQICLLRRLGIFVTSDNENLSDFGIKRIYQTTAYATIIKINEKLTVESAAAFFTAADDADEIIAVPYDRVDEIEFAFGHHGDIKNAAQKIIEKDGSLL